MKQQIRKAKEERLKAQISAATQADKKKSKQIFRNEELISNDFFLTADSRFVSETQQSIDQTDEEDKFDPEAFIHKNQHLMPYYRQYSLEKRRI